MKIALEVWQFQHLWACGERGSYQAVENKARRQTCPVQTLRCGEPHERCGPTPGRWHCRALLWLNAQHFLQTGIQVHLELCRDINSFKYTQQGHTTNGIPSSKILFLCINTLTDWGFVFAPSHSTNICYDIPRLSVAEEATLPLCETLSAESWEKLQSSPSISILTYKKINKYYILNNTQ